MAHLRYFRFAKIEGKWISTSSWPYHLGLFLSVIGEGEAEAEKRLR